MASDLLALLPEGSFRHVSVLVHDIEKSVDEYVRILGVERPPITWTAEADVSKAMYRGNPTPARCRQAFIDMGGVSNELIQPDEHPSAWREGLEKNGQLLHHMAFWVEDAFAVGAQFEERGFPCIMSGEWRGGRYSYFDTEKELGFIVELLMPMDNK